MPPLYDLVIRPGPCEAYYRELAHRVGGPVLELACGTGRLTIPIAADGHEVVGLDASPAMLRRARQKAESWPWGSQALDTGANSPDDLDVTFVEGDMRSFDLGRRFPLVIVSCNSLAHLITNDELKTCFSTVLRHLAPGGLFAFDIVNPDVRALARDTLESVRLDLGPNRSSGIAVEETRPTTPSSRSGSSPGACGNPRSGCAKWHLSVYARSSRRSCRCCWRRQAWNWPPATATSLAIR